MLVVPFEPLQAKAAVLGSKAMGDVDAFAANGKRGLGVDDAVQGRTKRLKQEASDAPSPSVNGASPIEVG